MLQLKVRIDKKDDFMLLRAWSISAAWYWYAGLDAGITGCVLIPKGQLDGHESPFWFQM